MEEILTTGHAAERLGCSNDYICRLIRDGHIRALKVGNNYLIRQEWLDEYIASSLGNRHLIPEERDEIKKALDQGSTAKELAKKYKVSRWTIYNIRKQRNNDSKQ